MRHVDTKSQAFVRDIIVNVFKQETTDQQVKEIGNKIDHILSKVIVRELINSKKR